MFKAFTPHSAYKECSIGEYFLLKSIGKGSSSEVWLARHLLTGAQVVIKAISMHGVSKFFQEVHCFKSLNHPNITKLFEVIATKDRIFLAMEHVSGGDLLEHLQNYGQMNEREARTVFRQVVSAVEYCHQKGIIHRDLKPGNILVDSDMTIKLADFGFSKEVSDFKQNTFCGTVCYSAPEILQRHTYDGRKTDVWSLGVVLYRMLTGVVPFEGDSIVHVKKHILSGHFYVPYFMSREVKILLRKLLTIDPSERPTLEEVMKDPWLNKGQEEMLRPYIEQPLGELDPQVTEKMQSLGFKQDDIQESVTQRKFDRVMGTYLILRMMKTKMPGRTIRVKSYLSPDTSSLSLSEEDIKTEKPSIPPNCLRLCVPTPPSYLETMSTTTPEHSTDTPRAYVQLGSAGSPSTRSQSGSSPSPSPSPSRGGDSERATYESSLNWQVMARRAFQFFLKFTCCGPSTEKESFKRSKIKPA